MGYVASENGDTFVTVLEAHADQRPDHTALVFIEDGHNETGRMTYREVSVAARTLARSLIRHGFAGERVLIACPSPRDFLTSFLGCQYAGAIAVPVPAGLTRRLGRRVRLVAADCDPALLLVGHGVRPERNEEDLSRLQWMTVAEAGQDAGAPMSEGRVDRADAVAMLQYTSGSTRNPRGVAITHANLMANLAMLKEAAALAEETTVNWMPLHHDMGLIALTLQTLYGGGTCVLMAPVHFIQRPLRWLECISRYRATLSGAPTFAYRLCAERAAALAGEPIDLRTWDRAIVSAEAVRAEVLDAFTESFRPAGFREAAWFPAYGLAEATVFAAGGPVARAREDLRVDPGAFTSRPGRAVPVPDGGRVLVGCGRAPAGTDLRVVDPGNLTALADGSIGEIWLRGSHIAGGYWKTREAPRTFDAELGDGSTGWLRTGDLGFVLDGQVFFAGRLKDVLVIRGVNHYPQDLEETVASSHAAFAPDGGAAFSVEIAGEDQVVVVHEVRRQALGSLDAKLLLMSAVRDMTREHGIALYDLVLLRPRTLPRTSSGKVQRHRCRAEYLDGTLARLGASRWPGLGRYRSTTTEETDES